MTKSSLPSIVIVGRTNVGKSTLFNRLSEDVKSVAFDLAGVTRDFMRDTVCWQDRCFDLIDTGGIRFGKTLDPIEQQVRDQAINFIEQADVILFICDGTVGLLPEDREIARVIHKAQRPTILVVNKSDVKKAQEFHYEFEKLGFVTIVPVSAQHGTGIADLLELIVQQIPKREMIQEENPYCKVVILGKPNVGKSSLMNKLLDQERSIVADMPGTTRESITERVRFYKEDIQLTDTPGLRRPRAVKEPLEELMVRSSLRTLDDADVVLLMVDASEARISDQELKLAFYAFEEKQKALIFLFNKEDIVTENDKQELSLSLEPYEFLLNKVAQLHISCVSGKNVSKILPLVDKIYKRYTQRFSDQDLTRLFKDALQKTPLYKSNIPLYVQHAEQIKTRPITIVLRVNVPPYFGPSQLAFFDKCMRKEFDLQGVPIRFIVRGSTR